jgi:hypothetical protein
MSKTNVWLVVLSLALVFSLAINVTSMAYIGAAIKDAAKNEMLLDSSTEIITLQKELIEVYEANLQYFLDQANESPKSDCGVVI